MVRLAGANRLRLRNMIYAVFTVVISPSVHFRNIAGPVTMTCIDWRGPLKCIGIPWIWRGQLSSFENAKEEIEYKQQLQRKTDDGKNGYKLIEAIELLEALPLTEVVITAWHASQTFVVHRSENEVRTNDSTPKMNVT